MRGERVLCGGAQLAKEPPPDVSTDGKPRDRSALEPGGSISINVKQKSPRPEAAAAMKLERLLIISEVDELSRSYFIQTILAPISRFVGACGTQTDRTETAATKIQPSDIFQPVSEPPCKQTESSCCQENNSIPAPAEVTLTHSVPCQSVSLRCRCCCCERWLARTDATCR